MAPEVPSGVYDHKVDVFSFGIMTGEIVLQALIGMGKPLIRDTLWVYVPCAALVFQYVRTYFVDCTPFLPISLLFVRSDSVTMKAGSP